MIPTSARTPTTTPAMAPWVMDDEPPWVGSAEAEVLCEEVVWEGRKEEGGTSVTEEEARYGPYIA